MAFVDLITLSREYGAGASMLAAELGARLGWRVLDQEIALGVARRLGLPESAIEEWDEHVPGLLESVSNALVLGNPYILVDAEVAGRPDHTDVADATRQLLLEEAAHPPLIIVGHGGQSLFHGRPGAVHIRLVAPVEARVQRICARRGCNARDAMTLARRMDDDRAHYVREFYGRDVRDPLLYHLQINTGVIDMEEAVRLVLDLVEGRRHGAARGADALPGAEGNAAHVSRHR
jgi:cytidylate kinase